MALDRWQAADRDSPNIAAFSANVELGRQIDLILQMEGEGGTRDTEVLRVTGQELSRPRRWHKIFERMGLVYQDGTGSTRLTQLGETVKNASSDFAREGRRSLARHALSVLRKYQLRNPADETGAESYPPDTNIHPYWAIWKAAVELDGKLHWDELNRVLMWVLRHEDLDAAIARIKKARQKPGYDPENDDGHEHGLGQRAYDQETSTDGRDPAGQVRDQKTTPWFKRAGLGELLLISPGRDGGGYWSIHPDVQDLMQTEVQNTPPEYKDFASSQAWFDYYGRIEESITNISGQAASLINDLPDEDEVWKKITALVAAGSVGAILSGPPGTSKTWYARKIASKIVGGNAYYARFIQFHPSYNYDDFVEGYVPSITKEGTQFAIKKKIFLQLCDSAQKEPSKTFVLVIDELNRGDPSKIFGELLTYIERDYRDQNISLAYSGTVASIPKNIFVIATMNPYDKSVSDLDDAFERRFDRVALDPSVTILNNLLTKEGMNGELRGKVISFFTLANKKSPHGIGHTWFIGVKDAIGLERLWDHRLRFFLEKTFRFEPEAQKELFVEYQKLLGPSSDTATT